MSYTNEQRLADLVDDMLNRLDRIEQILREMGHCDRCRRAHRRGVVDCIENGLRGVEEQLDQIIKSYDK